MPLFALIGLDHPPHAMARRDAVRTDHRRYVLSNEATIALVGPFVDDDGNQCGSFYIFDAESDQQVRDWLANEPFIQEGVYADVIIRRFELGMNRLQAQNWPVLTPG